MLDLASMQAAHRAAHAHLNATINAEFPGRDEWDWHRAHNHLNGTPFRRNDDTSQDAALAASPAIEAAWRDYIDKLHAFYRARDGEHGVLGGRGL